MEFFNLSKWVAQNGETLSQKKMEGDCRALTPAQAEEGDAVQNWDSFT